jgi:hypothetical protein
MAASSPIVGQHCVLGGEAEHEVGRTLFAVPLDRLRGCLGQAHELPQTGARRDLRGSRLVRGDRDTEIASQKTCIALCRKRGRLGRPRLGQRGQGAIGLGEAPLGIEPLDGRRIP